MRRTRCVNCFDWSPDASSWQNPQPDCVGLRCHGYRLGCDCKKCQATQAKEKARLAHGWRPAQALSNVVLGLLLGATACLLHLFGAL